MESTFRLRRSIIAAMLLALTLVLGRFFLIPIPWTHGNVNLCDAGVFIAAMLLGPGAGTIVGGFGGMFLDLISGFPQDALFSFAAHGLEGFISGWIYKKIWQHHLGQMDRNLGRNNRNDCNLLYLQYRYVPCNYWFFKFRFKLYPRNDRWNSGVNCY